MQKKAIYFTLEAVIAMMVISVGFGILLYMFVVTSTPPISTVQSNLYDMVKLFNMPIYSIGNGTCSKSGNATLDGNITDTSSTFFNQLGEFYYRYTTQNCEYCDDLITTCVTDYITYRNINDQNIQISIEGIPFYNSTTINQENATALFPFPILLFGIQNNSAMWGPYTGEIRVWQ
ncbi:MAG: hypothetical protein WC254_05340 [Candidatus Woesearchaeota archaeon]|jgi:hypothetical protein